MTDIIIIGGGLTGISAAWELENLGITDYTLIEVKPRLGGAIYTEKRNGFIMDGSAFVIEKYGAWDFLEPLGLSDAIRHVGRYRDGRLAIFKDGTQTLVDAIAQRLRPPMFRMAVSSVGRMGEHQYGVCLENGLLLTCKALIITAPARYAEHLLYSLSPQAALLLNGYQYDQVARVHLGYRKTDIEPLPAENAAADSDLHVKYIEGYDYPDRVPDGCVLIRAGVRVTDEMGKNPSGFMNALIEQVKKRCIVAHNDPLVEWAFYWAEADPLTRHLPEHLVVMDQIEALLPPNVALVGSDYRAKRLDQQVSHGREAARKIKAVMSNK